MRWPECEKKNIGQRFVHGQSVSSFHDRLRLEKGRRHGRSWPRGIAGCLGQPYSSWAGSGYCRRIFAISGRIPGVVGFIRVANVDWLIPSTGHS
jgi:hypothetical protein